MFTDETDGSAGGGQEAADEDAVGGSTAGEDAVDAGGDAAGAVGVGVSLGEAVALARRAQEALAAVEVHGEADRAVLDAAADLSGVANRLAGQQLRLLEEIDRRGAYERDGAVTTAAWWRGRTRVGHAAAGREVKAAVRLRHLPALRGALRAGDVALAHVTAVTEAVTPRRREAFAACDDTLAGLSRQASPREVRRAVAAVCEQADADGGEPEPLDESGPDERRRLSLQRTVDGLGDLRAVLDPLAAEALATLLDAWETPDGPDAAEGQARTPAQRRADAFADAVDAALAAGTAPATGGVKPHIVATIDLLGLPDPTGPAPTKPAPAPQPPAAPPPATPPPATPATLPAPATRSPRPPRRPRRPPPEPAAGGGRGRRGCGSPARSTRRRSAGWPTRRRSPRC